MNKLSVKSKIYLSFQVLFTILTFVGFIFVLTGVLKTAGMSICCMSIALVFRAFYDSSKNK